MFLSALVLNGLLLVVAAVQASRAAPPSQVALWLALAFIPNAMLLGGSTPPRWLARRPERWALGYALVPGLCLVAAPSVLSDDLYRFAWDARLWLHGHDAYARAPADPSLATLRDAIYAGINYPSLATIYPPLSQGLFAIGYGIGRGLWSIKLVALGAHLITIRLLSRPDVRRLAGHQAQACAGRIYGFALNPLALAETGLSGHIDGYVGLCVLLSAAAFARGRSTSGTAFLAACSGLKLVGGVFAPWLLRRQPMRALLLIVVTAAMTWPLVTAGGSHSPSGLGQYAQRWYGNEGGFALLRALSEPLSRWVSSADEEECGEDAEDEVGALCLGILVQPLRFLEDQQVSVAFQGAERRRPWPLGLYPRAYVTGIMARALFLAILTCVAFGLGRRAPQPKDLRTLLLVLLLCTPQVHPWYLLWLLPLDIGLGRKLATAWCAAILATYAPLDGWVTMRVWIPTVWAQWLQYGLVCAMLALELECGWARLTRFRPRHKTRCG